MAKKKSKQKATYVTKTNVIAEAVSDVVAAATSKGQPTLLKMCRLCETTDGPFLNIFDVERTISKKIDMLLPFNVSEYDDLPHKICFRCSAKVEELYDFVQKCVATQKNLQKVSGKDMIPSVKGNMRKIWEQKLNRSNISNDEICDAVIQKAMAGIADLPLNPLPLEELVTNRKNNKTDNKPKEPKLPEAVVETPPPKKLRTSNASEKTENTTPVRATRSNNSISQPDVIETVSPKVAKKRNERTKTVDEPKPKKAVEASPPPKQTPTVNSFSNDYYSSDNDVEEIFDDEQPKEADTKLFDIMDYISTIKVNGVGILFQCKLCNRNFLKKDIVLTHSCAKAGIPKINAVSNVTNVDKPKTTVPSVKFINNKPNPEVAAKIIKSEPDVKPKPRIGPASKVKKTDDVVPSVGMKITPREQTPPKVTPSVSHDSLPLIEVPPIPGMKSRYKLVPGPNNTFTLIEDSSSEPQNTQTEQQKPVENVENKLPEKPGPSKEKKKKVGPKSKVKHSPVKKDTATENGTAAKTDDIPYPVGLFQAIPSNTNSTVKNEAPPPFTTPAMKKQSYTIVQTGNPSKLLISTKAIDPAVKEKEKSKSKKKKHEPKVTENQPFNVTLEDNAREKDEGFFTFINVDPLLQPSYVLPTNNIIQESQISSSAVASSSKQKDMYDCTMCSEKFTREKKLLAHLKSHYNKMDEDEINEKTTRKRSRKS